MKKLTVVCMMVVMLMALGISVYAEDVQKQTASAVLDYNDEFPVEVTVDLTGGWSVEFGYGVAYLYDVSITDNTECVAMGLTLEKDVYAEYLTDSVKMEDYQKKNGVVSYTDESSNSKHYLFDVDGRAYFLVAVDLASPYEGDNVFSRFEVALSDVIYDSDFDVDLDLDFGS